MEAAVFDTVAVDLVGRRRAHAFRANGSTLVSPGFLAVYRESFDDVTLDDDTDRMLPALEVGDRVTARRAQARAALHGTAAALLGSESRQGARGVRHRPAIDLREHHPDAAVQEVLRARQQALHPDRSRQDRQPLPDRQLRALRRLRLHGRDGRRARQHLARRRGLGAGARAVLGRRSSAQIDDVDGERHAPGRRAGARARCRPGRAGAR